MHEKVGITTTTMMASASSFSVEEVLKEVWNEEGVSAFGVTVENDRINFTEKKRLVHDLSKLSDIPKDDILNTSLKKSFGGKRKGFLAKVLVSTDKPFIISYDRKECGEKNRVRQLFLEQFFP